MKDYTIATMSVLAAVLGFVLVFTLLLVSGAAAQNITKTGPYPYDKSDMNARFAIGTADNATGEVEFIGYAMPGCGDAQACWQVRKLFYNAAGDVTSWDYANSDNRYRHVWDDRASYWD